MMLLTNNASFNVSTWREVCLWVSKLTIRTGFIDLPIREPSEYCDRFQAVRRRWIIRIEGRCEEQWM